MYIKIVSAVMIDEMQGEGKRTKRKIRREENLILIQKKTPMKKHFLS